tara:strand:+ start:258 stop:989 length:732 start_codon:yes stop_codon:yes gene_type:complete
MAIEIDTIYQRVLAVINKEQRGYITPQEFNLFANQAQMNIFEQYFYDLELRENSGEEDEGSISNMIELIDNKIGLFTSIHDVMYGTVFKTIHPTSLLPVYRTGRIIAGGYTAKKVTENEANNLIGSAFHKLALSKNPIYRDSMTNGEDIEVFNSTGQLTTGVTCEYIVKPAKVEWGYSIIGGKAMYNANRSADSNLHASEESAFVDKILVLAGLTLRSPEISNIAIETQKQEVASEKMNIKQR